MNTDIFNQNNSAEFVYACIIKIHFYFIKNVIRFGTLQFNYKDKLELKSNKIPEDKIQNYITD